MQAELKKRILSAAVLAPVVLGIVYLGGTAFMLLMAACFVLMYREWLTITKSATNRIEWAAWGFIYLAVPCAMLALFRVSTEGKWDEMVYLTLAVVWATDIGAYFVGRKFGKHKLAPKISPKKSWEGLLGGMVCAALAVVTGYHAFYSNPPSATALPILISLAAGLAVVAQMGDLYESWIKRKFGVKDSGNLIPGHGGLLDRLDGVLSVTWALTILWAVFG